MRFRRSNRSSSHLSYRAAKTVYQLRLVAWQRLRDGMLITLGILAGALGLKGFLVPVGFIDGGVTGISLLVTAVTGWPLPPLVVLINLPFLWLAYRHIAPGFAVKSAMAICGLALAIALIPIPDITQDKVLIAAFGGFFLGAGVGLTMRGGAVLDGTEILAIYLGRKTGLGIGDTILALNVLIFVAAAYLLNVETVMYAILTFLAASRTVDFVIEGVEEYIGVTIVSSHYEEVRAFIVDDMQRGVTLYKGYRGHGEREGYQATEILFTVITRLEVARLQNHVALIDPNAFVAMHAVRDTHGGILKKRRWKEH